MRRVEIKRKTNETDIILNLNLDGSGEFKGNTDIGFFDHMLNSLTKMANIDIDLKVKGDLNVDSHHTIEDIGIVLGDAFLCCLGDKKGIERIGSIVLPMDDVLILCAIDFSGRPYMVFDCELPFGKVGGLETELVQEFFRALSNNAKMNLHLKLIHGFNSHHIIEAIFKSVGKCIYKAKKVNHDILGILSTKGSL